MSGHGTTKRNWAPHEEHMKVPPLEAQHSLGFMDVFVGMGKKTSQAFYLTSEIHLKRKMVQICQKQAKSKTELNTSQQQQQFCFQCKLLGKCEELYQKKHATCQVNKKSTSARTGFPNSPSSSGSQSSSL